MKRLLFVISALSAILCTPLSAVVPVCHLGGPTAMNPHRQLAEGETFATTDRPLVVNLRFKPTKEHPEQVGECMLPAGTAVAQKDGVLQWVLECGNDEVNRNIPVGPKPTPTPQPTSTPEPKKIVEVILTSVPTPSPTTIPATIGPQPTPTATPSPTATATPTSKLQFGLTGGVSRNAYSGPIMDRDICEIKSWGLFAGVAYGDPNRLFGRLTFMAVLVGDSSSSSYICPNCGTVTIASRGMKVLGGNIELVGLLGPTTWKLQPTLSIGGGAGVVTGQADRYVTRNGSIMLQHVGADELLGYKIQGHGGGGVGLAWHASSQTMLELGAKYMYPYGYSVGITLTKWLGKK